MDYWLDNAPDGGPHIIVDCGYVNCQLSRDRADRIIAAGVGKKNLQIAAGARVLIRIPPGKLVKVLTACPDIRPASEAPGYCWCTHTWICETSTDLKWCAA